MDAELKAKWVAALRSKKYRQTRKGALRWRNAYCCIGVLGDVAQPGLLKKRDEIELETCTLSALLDVGGLPSVEQQETLAHMNDGEGEFDAHSFGQIADYIEANL